MSDTKTIAGQLADALAEVAKLKSVIERQPTMKHFHGACEKIAELDEQAKKLREENAALKAAADQAKDFEARVSAEVNRRVAELTKNVQSEINKRADARAVEIMASVGQPTPLGGFGPSGPEGRQMKQPPSGIRAVEEMYKRKYENTNE